jgi:hypothetical protein
MASVRTWHPRFPPVAHEIPLAAGQTERIDLQVGVDRSGGDAHASH